MQKYSKTGKLFLIVQQRKIKMHCWDYSVDNIFHLNIICFLFLIVAFYKCVGFITCHIFHMLNYRCYNIFYIFEFSALFYFLKLCFIVICFTKCYQKLDFLMLQYRCLTTMFAVSMIIAGLQLLDVCNHIHGYSLLLENVFDMPDAV